MWSEHTFWDFSSADPGAGTDRGLWVRVILMVEASSLAGAGFAMVEMMSGLLVGWMRDVLPPCAEDSWTSMLSTSSEQYQCLRCDDVNLYEFLAP